MNNVFDSVTRDLETWQEVEADLIRQAEGVFQCVHLMVPIVEKQINNGHSLKDVHRWLPRAPSKLNDVYKYILQHVIKLHDLKQSFSFFQWLGLAEQPLSVMEMWFTMTAKQVSASRPRIQCHETSDFIETDDHMKGRINAISGGLATLVYQDFDSEDPIAKNLTTKNTMTRIW